MAEEFKSTGKSPRRPSVRKMGKRSYSTRHGRDLKRDAEKINEKVSKQKISITEEDLSKLCAIQGVSFEVANCEDTYPGLQTLIGTPDSKLGKAGVYI